MTNQSSIAAFECACGTIAGEISPAGPSAGTHVECFCKDCRAGALWCGLSDPAPGGVRIYQTTPDAIRFTRGQDQLALFRLHPKGLLRWRAACCGVPLFNTLGRPKLAFAGVMVNRLLTPEVVGPVRTRAFVPGEAGKPPAHQGGLRSAFGVLSRMAAARLSGKWRNTPFFDPETGETAAKAQVLTKAERKAITKPALQQPR